MKKIFTVLFIILAANLSVWASHPIAATPRSARAGVDIDLLQTLVLQRPETAPLMALRQSALYKNELIPSATVVQAGIHPNTHGQWTTTADGYRVWQLVVDLPGAFGHAAYYDKFHLPEGCLLFVSDVDGHKRFAYDHTANVGGGHFSTPVLPGTKCLFEINILPGVLAIPDIQIEGMAYFFVNEGITASNAHDAARGFGDAEDCHININCEEGDNWQGEKRAVVRILTRVGSNAGWCTGTIMNNTFQDCTPYILTADHCREIDGVKSSNSDYDQFQFYFGYEGPGCKKPDEADVPVGSLTGAIFRAGSTSSGDEDSDFLLLELQTQIPSFYNPVFAGWYNQNVSSDEGVMIHHPAGDIKKISTFTQPIQSSTWGNKILNTHWKVRWAQTKNGKSVSQGGSSGSALFNDFGYVIGHLTGGNTSCIDSGGFSPNGYDLFGKFSYSFLWHNENPAENLFDWLDKGNSHLMFLPSIAWPCSELPVGEEAFVAGEQHVLIYPNPAQDVLYIELPKPAAVKEMALVDLQGRIIQTLPPQAKSTLELNAFLSGIYLLKIIYFDGHEAIKKVVVQ
jgi:hypothetical protein